MENRRPHWRYHVIVDGSHCGIGSYWRYETRIAFLSRMDSSGRTKARRQGSIMYYYFPKVRKHRKSSETPPLVSSLTLHNAIIMDESIDAIVELKTTQNMAVLNWIWRAIQRNVE